MKRIKIKVKPTADSRPVLEQELGKVNMRRMRIEELRPADYNPRIMTDRARQGLSNSIDAFGLLEPVIFNEQTGNVVGGHQRLYDLIAKGVKETDVVVVNLSLPQEKAANIALNNNALSGEFTDNLQILLDDIPADLSKDLLLDDLKIKDDFDIDSEDTPEDNNNASRPTEAENIVTIEFLPEDYELFLRLIEKFKVDYQTPSVAYKYGLKLGQLLREYENIIG